METEARAIGDETLWDEVNEVFIEALVDGDSYHPMNEVLEVASEVEEESRSLLEAMRIVGRHGLTHRLKSGLTGRPRCPASDYLMKNVEC